MNDDKEREVSIGEVFLNIFKHWKIIVVAMIIGTVLLGGYSYYKNNEQDKIIVNNKKELTDSEKEYVDTIVEQYKEAKSNQEDYANTYLCKMNPNAVYERDINYYVKLTDNYEAKEKELILTDIMDVYNIFLNSQEFRYGITETINSISTEEVSYLVSIKYNNRILSINIKASTKNDVDKIRNYIVNKITEYTGVVQNAVAFHSIELYNEKEYRIKDLTINDAQKSYKESLNSQMDLVKSTFANMKYEQVELFEEQVEERLTKLFNTSYENLGVKIVDNANVIEEPVKVIDKKYIVIGAILGAFISAIAIFCRTIFSKKIVLCDDIKMYGYETYGPVTSGNKIGRMNKKIYDIHQDKEEQIKYIEKRLSMDARKFGAKIIGVVSSIDDAFVNEFVENLKIDGVEIATIGGTLRDTDALKKFDEYDNVVFVEQFNKTIKKEYEYEIHLADKSGKNILGTIMVV